MLATGNQLRAALALLAMEREALAKRAGLDVAAIVAMENCGRGGFDVDQRVIAAVAAALDAAGVELFNNGRPGVRLRDDARGDALSPHAKSNDEWPEADA